MKDVTPEQQIEQSLLGALLIDNRLLDACGDLSEKHFDVEYHAALFRTLRLMVERGEAASPRTILPYLDKDDPAYVGALVSNATSATPESARHFANAIQEAWRRRRLIDVANDMGNWAKLPDPDRSVADVVAAAQSELDDIASAGHESGPALIADAFEGGLNDLDRRIQAGSNLVGHSTGLADLDDALGGLPPGNLIVPAGRPGMGKTALALWIGMHVAKTLGIPTLFFSLEMTARQLSYRALAALSGFNYHDIGRARISVDEFGAIRGQALAHKELPLIIDPTPALTASAIRSRVRSVMRHTPDRPGDH